MNVKLLIDEIIRQTTVTIAQLATMAGVRAPLSHVANQVFIDLVHELEEQGVGKKVAADMFGLALRSYQLKVQRLEESQTDRKQSLWEAIFEFINAQDIVSRAEVLQHFSHDDVASVKGILNDLIESNLVFHTGRGDGAIYRAVAPTELEQLVKHDERDAAPWRIWAHIYRNKNLTHNELSELTGLDTDALNAGLNVLLAEARITIDESVDGPRYSTDVILIPMDDPAGYETALFGHINALFTAMHIKLRQLKLRTMPEDVIGGSTYFFDVWRGHPYRNQVLALLKETRTQMSALREEVTTYNDDVGRPQEGLERVTFYFGQSVIRDESLDEDFDE